MENGIYWSEIGSGFGGTGRHTPTKNSEVYPPPCSAHFLEEDYKFINSQNKRLKDDACPSVFSWTEIAQERALPAKRAKLDEERKNLEEEETETASEGEGFFETVDEQRVNRGIQAKLEVECPHTMSLRILKSKKRKKRN